MAGADDAGADGADGAGADADEDAGAQASSKKLHNPDPVPARARGGQLANVGLLTR